MPFLTFSGTYSSAATYSEGNVVQFNGSSYVSLVNGNHGHSPSSSPSDWAVFAAQGPTGATGSTGSTGATGSTGSTGSQGPAYLPHVQANILINFVVPATNSGSGAGAGWGVAPVSFTQEIVPVPNTFMPGAVGAYGAGDPLDTNPYTTLFVSVSEALPFDLAIGTGFSQPGGGAWSGVLPAGQTSITLPTINGSPVTFSANEFGETFMIFSWNEPQTESFTIPVITWTLQ